MRRPISLRAMIALEFDQIEKTMRQLAETKDDTRREILAERLEGLIGEARDLCITSAAEQPALDEALLTKFVETADEARLAMFVRKHIDTQLRIVTVEGADVDRLIEEAFNGLREMDPDAFEVGLEELAREVVANQPQIAAQDFTAELLQTILREAVGLDGRIPEDHEDGHDPARRLLARLSTVGASPAP